MILGTGELEIEILKYLLFSLFSSFWSFERDQRLLFGLQKQLHPQLTLNQSLCPLEALLHTFFPQYQEQFPFLYPSSRPDTSLNNRAECVILCLVASENSLIISAFVFPAFIGLLLCPVSIKSDSYSLFNGWCLLKLIKSKNPLLFWSAYNNTLSFLKVNDFLK